MVQRARNDHHAGASHPEARLVDGDVFGFPLQQTHVAEVLVGGDAGACRETCGAPVDGEDAIEERRQQGQQQPVPGADVDAQACGPLPQKGAQQRQHPEHRRRTAADRGARRLVEEAP
jgi:hypothetical protein